LALLCVYHAFICVQVACHQLAITLGIAAAGGIGAALSEVQCTELCEVAQQIALVRLL
jgi:hypothetical protein